MRSVDIGGVDNSGGAGEEGKTGSDGGVGAEQTSGLRGMGERHHVDSGRAWARARGWGRRAWGLFVLLLLFRAPAGLLAHTPSDSYLSITVDGARLSGEWEIAVKDLDFLFGLDTDGDGNVTWGELRTRHDEIGSYALSKLRVAADGADQLLSVTEQLVADHPDGTFSVLRFEVAGTVVPSRLRVGYELFFEHDPLHRGLFQLVQGSNVQASVFKPSQSVQEFELSRPSPGARLGAFVRDGVHHIWTGYDHILFLMALLLPSVLVVPRRGAVGGGGGVAPCAAFRPALVAVVKIVTAFTVAHSLTLSLATLGWVRLPSRWVESVIAASVVVAALNNLRPWVREGAWGVAFVFGLIHGFGFAGVLEEMALPRASLVLALFGFNLGVEAGQLAIVLVFLPLAFALRRTAFYTRVVFQAGSVLIALIAAGWCVERLAGRSFMPF